MQVKDTAAKVTINSGSTRDALTSFVDLVERNPGREIHLRFLSTSSVGQEHRRDHRASGEPSLLYWRRAAAGADVKPLREVLTRLDLSSRVRSFVESRGDAALRNELLRRIHWDCGQRAIDSLRRELENGLLRYYVDRFRIAARRDQLADAVVQRVFMAIIEGDERRLTDADLLALVTDASSVLVARPEFEIMMRTTFGGAQEAVQIEAGSSRLLLPEQDLPLPPILAPRTDVTSDLLKRAQQDGISFVTGSTGCGKTIVARLTARAYGSRWSILDLRDASAEDIVQRLDFALGSLSALGSVGIILDDLNEAEDPSTCRALSGFLSALRRRDMLCLITAYRKPSNRVLSDLGIDEGAHLAVPDLSPSEVGAMVSAAGGDAEKWTTLVRMAGGFGHPQLVQAVISGLRTRGWPERELKSLQAFARSSDIEVERRAARNRLVTILSEQSRALLYRVSILLGWFDRPLALTLGNIGPPIREPGTHLDHLIGPWIELSSFGGMRISPLVQNAGNEVLTADEVRLIHETAAQEILGGHTVAIEKANSGFLHALLSKSGWLLKRLAYNIIMSSPTQRRSLSEWISSLRLHRLDRQIFPDQPALSILLRLAQFLLIAVIGRPTAIRNAWRVLDAELRELNDVEAREHLEYMAIAKALFDQDAIAFLPDCVDLMLRFGAFLQADPDRSLLDQRLPSPDGARTLSLLGTLFITYGLRMPSVAHLQRAFNRLDAATSEQRAALLNDTLSMPGDCSVVVNHAWLEESKRENPDWPAFSDAYRRMAAQAISWGYRELALRCHVVRAIISDEYLDNAAEAFQALDEATQLLGNDPVLERARAKILYRRKDHASALRVFRKSGDRMEVGSPVARAFMLREAGISAAEVGEWRESQQWFAAAREAATAAATLGMNLLGVGLRADEALSAYQAGEIHAALTGLDLTLDELQSIAPDSSIAAGYRHRVVRHSILWLFEQATAAHIHVHDEPTVMVPGICSNPEPPDLSDMPLPSIDYARYLLAQVEIAARVSAGIESGLRAHLGGRAIPAMEIFLRGERVKSCLRHLDAKGLVAVLPSWVDSQIYSREHPEIIRQSEPNHPVYGEIDPATPEQLRTELGAFMSEDALLSFGIIAALESEAAALAALCAQGAEIPSPYAGKAIIEILASGESARETLQAIVAMQIHVVAHQTTLTPHELFVAGVRFVQWAKGSNFENVLAPALATWPDRFGTTL